MIDLRRAIINAGFFSAATCRPRRCLKARPRHAAPFRRCLFDDAAAYFFRSITVAFTSIDIDFSR